MIDVSLQSQDDKPKAVGDVKILAELESSPAETQAPPKTDLSFIDSPKDKAAPKNAPSVDVTRADPSEVALPKNSSSDATKATEEVKSKDAPAAQKSEAKTPET